MPAPSTASRRSRPPTTSPLPARPISPDATQVIRAAADQGLNVILDPVDTGGFMPVLRQNGLEKCRTYGRYLGDRYKDFDNIIWMSGSDFQSWRTASDNALVKAVADGIRETDSRHIHTLQLDYFVSSSLDNSAWSGLVTLNAAYTYYPAYAEVLEGYNRPRPSRFS